jgi:uncharacterized membrane protein
MFGILLILVKVAVIEIHDHDQNTVFLFFEKRKSTVELTVFFWIVNGVFELEFLFQKVEFCIEVFPFVHRGYSNFEVRDGI